MFDVDAIINVWHEGVVQFGRELEDFLNHLPSQRARFWNIDLWLWLQDQRARGFKVDSASYGRLRQALDELRDDLIDQGVELQQVYTPSPEQQARERAAIRARNERNPTSLFAAPAVGFIPPRARMAPDDAEQGAPSPTDDQVRYWVERLRGLIQSIMQSYPAERWVEKAAAAMKRIGVPQQIADRILEWVQAESDRYLFFKRIVDEALRRSAEESVPIKRSPAEELVDLAIELAKGLKELSADGKPERLFGALQKLIDRFPELVPESLRSQDLDELLADIQQTMQALLDFLKILPPEAYAVIPDLLQGMLDILGLIPVVGEVADAISGIISYYRGEILAAALTVASLIPLLGAIPGVAKILVRLARILKVVRKMGKRAVREALEKLLKFLIDELGGITPSAEWLRKFLERLRKLLRELLEKLKKGPDGPKTPGGGKDPPTRPGPPKPKAPAVDVPTDRGGLRRAMGQPPLNLVNPNAHHDLAWKYKTWFAMEGRGLNVNEARFGRWVEGTPPGRHQLWSAEFDSEWETFIFNHLEADQVEVLEFMNKLRNDPRFQ